MTVAGFWKFVEAYAQPAEWPLNLRRLFVLTLPVSGPLWLASMAAFVIVLVIAGAGLWLFEEATPWLRRMGFGRAGR